MIGCPDNEMYVRKLVPGFCKRSIKISSMTAYEIDIPTKKRPVVPAVLVLKLMGI